MAVLFAVSGSDSVPDTAEVAVTVPVAVPVAAGVTVIVMVASVPLASDPSEHETVGAVTAHDPCDAATAPIVAVAPDSVVDAVTPVAADEPLLWTATV